MGSYLKFKGVQNIGDSLLSEQLEANIVEYFKWGMLNIGGFNNVVSPTSGVFGGDFSKLKFVDNPQYKKGTIWEGVRQDWVWESGVDYGYQPISISGVSVNGVFYPSNTSGAYAHNISYPNGQVVFNTAISTNSVVKVNYSYRNYYINHSSVPWFKELFSNSHRPDLLSIPSFASGVMSTLAENRIQMPAIIVDVTPDRIMKPYEVGNSSQTVSQDVLFYIFAESPAERNKAVDIITYQKDNVLNLFDKNKLIENNKYPLDYSGFRVSGAITYPEMVNPTGSYYGGKYFIKDCKVIPTASLPPLYKALVKMTVELDMLF